MSGERSTLSSEIGRKFGLKRDWVLFPTRDETVAAFFPVIEVNSRSSFG